uniref:Uncharacterized protein n=1 Tax=Candidozyma auris TaxID=498019 RepID=A0A0L0NRT4_CANAR
MNSLEKVSAHSEVMEVNQGKQEFFFFFLKKRQKINELWV